MTVMPAIRGRGAGICDGALYDPCGGDVWETVRENFLLSAEKQFMPLCSHQSQTLRAGNSLRSLFYLELLENMLHV
jgi:hypothetical protein